MQFPDLALTDTPEQIEKDAIVSLTCSTHPATTNTIYKYFLTSANISHLYYNRHSKLDSIHTTVLLSIKYPHQT